MRAQPDSYYISQVLNGNDGAFSTLVDRYKDLAYTIAVKIVRDDEDAEEVAQDAFVKAWKSLGNFKGDAAFSTWLYRIVYTSAISKTRKKKLEVAAIDDHIIENHSVDALSGGFSKIRAEERKRFLGEALKQLPKEDSLLITLYYLEEKTIEEINVITELTKSNIKVKLHRGRKKLLAALQGKLKGEVESLL